MNTQATLEKELNSFDPLARRGALDRLAAQHSAALPPAGANVNMHFHSFFSYNAEGYSPSRIAWEARKAGLYAAALCDFDVLDGLEEFLDAGQALGLRTAVHLETRAFVKEYGDVDISSPGEPGVAYIMGAGFARPPQAGTAQADGLAGYRRRAQERNLAAVQRVNAHLPEIAIDYERDVLPLTPAGAATERHIIAAYVNKAAAVHAAPDALAGFWSGLLGKSRADAQKLLADRPALEESVRSKLVKKGGVGYVQPSPGTFPPAEDFARWVASCDAIPMIAWLDGTSAGERDARAVLACMTAKGCAALNIIPDRNWNIANAEQKAVKVANLNAMVAAANDLGLPINIGTEMNKLGLPFVDSLDADALRPHKEAFLRGARIMVGHTLLLRHAGYSYIGARAAAEYPDIRKRNAFFESVGARAPLRRECAKMIEAMSPDRALEWLRGGAGR